MNATRWIVSCLIVAGLLAGSAPAKELPNGYDKARWGMSMKKVEKLYPNAEEPYPPYGYEETGEKWLTLNTHVVNG